MKSEIRFETMVMEQSKLGNETSVPDLIGGLILQNNLQFQLGEEEEIFEGYGRCKNSYPYRQFACYSNERQEESIQTIVLENDYLKATFLPELGGRLWSLWDKTKNRNLLYTNDVLQFRNLATRNAWFSGGVEWNLGVIGHTPFTTAPLFIATLKKDKKTPVLRMYEYERIRQVTYQMDFWLGEEDKFLNARMRIVNFLDEVVPMYWWSNIAVPEYQNGRIIVPSKEAYTLKENVVYKTEIPIVDGVDITSYENIPASIDYFFDIKTEDPKYIVNVDEQGYGLLQMSTNRLRARKLFSWGKKQAGEHWQQFLTKDAGNYVEIQAGLGKTQYGCIPMPPHTAWEWLERYGAIELEEEERKAPFAQVRESVTNRIKGMNSYQEMEDVLYQTKQMAKTKAEVHQQGSGYGALKNEEQKAQDRPLISTHLDFGTIKEEQEMWKEFLITKQLKQLKVDQIPKAFMNDDIFYYLLKEWERSGEENWYGHYQLGIYYFQKEHYELAKKEWEVSIQESENAWAYHGLASLFTVKYQKEEAKKAMKQGLQMRLDDISYVKEGLRILCMNDGMKEILEVYSLLKKESQEEGRVKFYYILALAKTGEEKKAYELLCENGGLLVPDMREGEVAIGELWKELYKTIYGVEETVPYQFDFVAI